MHRLAHVLALLSLTVAPRANACMWDYDTIADENTRVPTAIETLAGAFPRHSTAFYAWRAEDRQRKLATDPNNLALLDDLGVALCKTGRAAEGVAIGERALALDPGRYESEANLGTYYIFAGDLDKARAHIERALQINPDAHFGREKYQLYLVDLLIERRDAKGGVPEPVPRRAGVFARFLREAVQRRNGTRADADAEVDKAVVGVLGMMRFARHDLPALDEALGDLLLPAVGGDGNQQIAARAYLLASYHAEDEASVAAYRQLARSALEAQDGITFGELESDFKDEIAQGDAYMAKIAADEAEWIRTSPDPDAAFDAVYRADPPLHIRDRWWRKPPATVVETFPQAVARNLPPETPYVLVAVVVGLPAVSLAGLGLLWLGFRRRRA